LEPGRATTGIGEVLEDRRERDGGHHELEPGEEHARPDDGEQGVRRPAIHAPSVVARGGRAARGPSNTLVWSQTDSISLTHFTQSRPRRSGTTSGQGAPWATGSGPPATPTASSARSASSGLRVVDQPVAARITTERLPSSTPPAARTAGSGT